MKDISAEMLRIKEKFKNHVLTEVINNDIVKIYDYKKSNGDRNYYQRWIIDRGTLIITGDCYSAIYKWNESHISLNFLSNCNIDYFSEKCQADKDGSSQEVYDAECAESLLKEIASDRIYENLCEYDIEELKMKTISDEIWDMMDTNAKFEYITPIIMCELSLGDISEMTYIFYNETLEQAYSVLNDTNNRFMFGIDGWEYTSMLNVYTGTPKMHLSALRSAYEKYGSIF